jgi:hypothetical protein
MKTRVRRCFDFRVGADVYYVEALQRTFIPGHYSIYHSRESYYIKEWSSVGFITIDRERAERVAIAIANKADTEALLDIVASFGIDDQPDSDPQPPMVSKPMP